MNNSKGLSIAALVCGIIGIVGGWIPGVTYVALPLAILGIIFGVIGMKKAKASGESKGLAVAGLVCGIIGTVFAVIGLICVVCVFATASSIVNNADLNSLASALSSLS